jgi:hypothetical protein
MSSRLQRGRDGSLETRPGMVGGAAAPAASYHALSASFASRASSTSSSPSSARCVKLARHQARVCANAAPGGTQALVSRRLSNVPHMQYGPKSVVQIFSNIWGMEQSLRGSVTVGRLTMADSHRR